MDRIAEPQVNALADIARIEVEKYAGIALDGKMYFTLDEHQHIYTVILVFTERKFMQSARVVVMAQVVDELVIVLEDNTDKPLVDALVQAGIPRQQIVLAYAGETVPTENAE